MLRFKMKKLFFFIILMVSIVQGLNINPVVKNDDVVLISNVLNLDCTEQYSCSDWGSCVDGQKIRTCTDTNFCGSSLNFPQLTSNCIAVDSIYYGGVTFDITDNLATNYLAKIFAYIEIHYVNLYDFLIDVGLKLYSIEFVQINFPKLVKFLTLSFNLPFFIEGFDWKYLSVFFVTFGNVIIGVYMWVLLLLGYVGLKLINKIEI